MSSLPLRRPVRTMLAALAVAALAVLAPLLSAPAAVAAPVEYLDYADPVPDSNTGAYQPDPGVRIGQAFVPLSDGVATKMTVALNAAQGVFASASLYPVDGLGHPLADPLPGGVGVLGDLPSATGVVDVTVSFPDRPVLEAGTRYVLVIDPTSDAGRSSFIYNFGNPTSAIKLLYEAGGWAEMFTGNIYVSLWMAEQVTVTPLVPTVPAVACGVTPTVSLPTVEGVAYTSASRTGGVRVTASALPGYVLDSAATAEWEFDLAATPCPTSTPTATPEPATEPTADPQPVADDEPVEKLAESGSTAESVWAAIVVAIVAVATGIILRRRRG